MSIDISAITFSAVNDVTTSWDLLKATPDCDTVVAETLFRKIIAVFFEKKDPTAETSIPDPNDQNMNNPLFKIKSTMFVKMLDVVIEMLGPDLVPMAIMLQELGAKHYDYGVAPGDYEIVGDALFFTLEKYLGNKWNKKLEKSWRSVYAFISEAMVKGTEKEAAERAKGQAKRFSIPPRNSKLDMGKDSIAVSMKNRKAGLMGMLDKAISVTERGA
eukprot:CAMPEP_0178849142 /NCGR_PEP_ID=MMETSP0746-20121128/19773_1 /TAXON_ID=913974 /ORGANISM="Nitzschia punctata, Strain CCMP561" /LENGTH=215 /DNA_ID=CAMNT_0020514305 /DNA_START=55 /DNA_END=702 /DNA_ORIENTATION=-